MEGRDGLCKQRFVRAVDFNEQVTIGIINVQACVVDERTE